MSTISSDREIVPGQRFGDVASVDMTLEDVEAFDARDVFEAGGARLFTVVTDEASLMVEVCLSDESVHSLSLIEDRAGLRTAEGIGLGSERADLVAAYGEPGDMVALGPFTVLEYGTDVPRFAARYIFRDDVEGVQEIRFARDPQGGGAQSPCPRTD